eukprot:COSAG02_NODE_1781_length_10947_cov_54.689159_2_plen_342_part_00
MEVQHLPQPPESESATTAQCSHGDSLGAPPAASAAKPSGSCSTAQTAVEVEEGTPPGAASEPQGPALLPLGDGDEFPDECLVVVCRFLTLRELGRLACAARRFTERTLTDPGPVAGQVDGSAKVLCSPIEEGARLQLAATADHTTSGAVPSRSAAQSWLQALWLADYAFLFSRCNPKVSTIISPQKWRSRHFSSALIGPPLRPRMGGGMVRCSLLVESKSEFHTGVGVIFPQVEEAMQSTLKNFGIGRGGVGLRMWCNRRHSEHVHESGSGFPHFVKSDFQLEDGMQLDISFDTHAMQLCITSGGEDIYRCDKIPAGSFFAVGEGNCGGGMVVRIVTQRHS